MKKCGKSFMPECEYFTTGGCVSPFNCPYKIEQEIITTAASTPLNPNVIYTTETDKDKEIARLTAENAELHARLDKAVVLKVNVRDTLYMPWKHNGIYGIATLEILEIRVGDEVKYITDIESDDEVFLYKYKCGIFSDEDFDNMVFTDSAKAEARLAELKGGEGE